MKRLVDKLADPENQVKKPDNSKSKDANSQLNDKKKELKKAKDDIEIANKRASDFQDIINQKNGRICELETTNTRLQLMYNHAKETKDTAAVDAKDTTKDETKDNKKLSPGKPTPAKVKCVYENSGNCRNTKCNFIHPKKTCQAHCRYGSCPSESICEHRHPSKVCFNLQHSGFCSDGDRCRMRHPVEYGSHEQPFLGQGRGFHQGHNHAVGGQAHAHYGPDNQHASPGSPYLAPGEPWSPPCNNYRPFQNRGKGPRGGQRNQF